MEVHRDDMVGTSDSEQVGNESGVSYVLKGDWLLTLR